MSSFINRTIVCGCCGKEFTARSCKGYFNSALPDLDTNPHHPAIYDTVTLCPFCGYASDTPGKAVSAKCAEAVKSAEYQAIFKNQDIPELMKKEYLNAVLRAADGEHLKAAVSYLHILWKSREEGIYNAAALSNAIEQLEKHLETHRDLSAAIMLIDCQRQHSDFSQARERAESLMRYAEADRLKAILAYELHLIDAEDSAPHSQSEVQV